jgi:hypothetical protein
MEEGNWENQGEDGESFGDVTGSFAWYSETCLLAMCASAQM